MNGCAHRDRDGFCIDNGRLLVDYPTDPEMNDDDREKEDWYDEGAESSEDRLLEDYPLNPEMNDDDKEKE